MDKQRATKGILIPIEENSEAISHTSHELKSFITSCKAYVQLLERHIKKTSSDTKPLEYLERMDIQLSKLNNQISDFFDVVKLDSNTLEIFLEQVSSTDIVSSAINKIDKLQNTHKIIVKNVHECFILVDRQKMERVLIHLLTNAIKYSPEKKKIFIETYMHNKKLHISVINEGILVDDSEKENIFLPFYQSKKLGNQQGIGLGLFFAKNILTLHKGSINVITKNGKTIFTISIPVKKL